MVESNQPAPDGKFNVSSAPSSLVSLFHTERRMRIYGVTENELRTLTAINLGIATLFSVGSAMLGMGMDLHKDLLLATDLPPKAEILKPTSTILFLGCALFYIVGFIAVWMRRGFIETIKKESSLN